MNREHIENGQIVERYLQGKLTAAEEEAFEEYYLSNPEVLDDLEAAERLRQGMKDLATAHQLPARVAQKRPQWLRLRISPVYAAAASLLLAASLIFSGTLYRENAGLRQELQLIAGVERPRLVPILAVRGADVNTIAQPDAGEWTILLIDAGFEEYASYRATVIRQQQTGSEEVWELSDLTPGYEDMLAVGLPGHLLEPGRYDVQLAGRMRDWPAERGYDEISRTPFRIVSTAAGSEP